MNSKQQTWTIVNKKNLVKRIRIRRRRKRSCKQSFQYLSTSSRVSISTNSSKLYSPFFPFSACNSFCPPSVWPDVELRSSQNFIQKLPKSSNSSFCVKINDFQNSPKRCQLFGLILKKREAKFGHTAHLGDQTGYHCFNRLATAYTYAYLLWLRRSQQQFVKLNVGSG